MPIIGKSNMEISAITVITNTSNQVVLIQHQSDSAIELSIETVELVVKAMRQAVREIKEDS